MIGISVGGILTTSFSGTCSGVGDGSLEPFSSSSSLSTVLSLNKSEILLISFLRENY